MSSSPLPPTMVTAGRVAAWMMAGFLTVIVLLAAWVGIRGFLAYQHLTRIETGVADASTALASDPSAAGSVLAGLAADARAAHDLTSDPVWGLAEQTPWIGPQLRAFGVVAASGKELLSDALLPLVTAAQNTSFDALKPVNGRIDPSGLTALAAPAQDAAEIASRAATQIEDVDRPPLLGAVTKAVDRTGASFEKAARGLDALARATLLLPEVLGENGPRTYLIVVQNNAEWRSLGGIAGTAILLRTDAGAISLADTDSGGSLSQGLKGSVIDVPDDVKNIYDSRVAQFFQNVTQVPDFTFDGPLAQSMYKKATGVEVDGVLTMDPVVLSYLLRATGPVQLPDGESLASENAVKLLLSDVYQRFPDPSAQDAFFAQASGAVFGAFLGGKGSTVGLLTSLAEAVDERRVLFWSANPDEQAIIAASPMAGALPVTDEETARFGVYFNDGGGSKMSYYVKPEVSLLWGQCSGHARTLSLHVRLTNTAPADAGAVLPTYVTGDGVYGTAPGFATVVSNVYMPQGWELAAGETTDGTGYKTGLYEGRQVLTFGTSLAPQSSTDLTVTVHASSAVSSAEAFVTPTADASIDPTVTSTCENATVPGLN